MKTFWSIGACTNALTTLYCRSLRTNRAAMAIRVRKDLPASVAAYVSWFCDRACWLLQTTRWALHLRKWPCLSYLYIYTHMQSRICFPRAMGLIVWLISTQDLISLWLRKWSLSASLNNWLKGWFSRSRCYRGTGGKALLCIFFPFRNIRATVALSNVFAFPREMGAASSPAEKAACYGIVFSVSALS